MGGKELIRCLSSYAPHAAFPESAQAPAHYAGIFG